jgi:sugar phosphate isomerase/epimerase
MIKISYRAHDYGKGSAYDVAKKVASHKLTAVQLVINKCIEGESGLAGTLNPEKCKAIYKGFADNGLEISLLGAYFNPVHSDKNKVEQMIAKFKEHLKYAKYFNCKYVGTETGSFNDDKWTYNPLNRTEEALAEDIRIFKDLAECAKENDSYLAIEGAYGHCMYSPDQLKRLFDAINNGHVKIIIDIFNYLDISNYNEQIEIFNRAIELFKDDVVVFHLKDFVVDNEANKLVQVGLGQGLMRWDIFFPIIKEKCPNAYLTFEGIKPKDIDSSIDCVYKYYR